MLVCKVISSAVSLSSPFLIKKAGKQDLTLHFLLMLSLSDFNHIPSNSAEQSPGLRICISHQTDEVYQSRYCYFCNQVCYRNGNKVADMMQKLQNHFFFLSLTYFLFNLLKKKLRLVVTQIIQSKTKFGECYLGWNHSHCTTWFHSNMSLFWLIFLNCWPASRNKHSEHRWLAKHLALIWMSSLNSILSNNISKLNSLSWIPQV